MAGDRMGTWRGLAPPRHWRLYPRWAVCRHGRSRWSSTSSPQGSRRRCRTAPRRAPGSPAAPRGTHRALLQESGPEHHGPAVPMGPRPQGPSSTPILCPPPEPSASPALCRPVGLLLGDMEGRADVQPPGAAAGVQPSRCLDGCHRQLWALLPERARRHSHAPAAALGRSRAPPRNQGAAGPAWGAHRCARSVHTRAGGAQSLRGAGGPGGYLCAGRCRPGRSRRSSTCGPRGSPCRQRSGWGTPPRRAALASAGKGRVWLEGGRGSGNSLEPAGPPAPVDPRSDGGLWTRGSATRLFQPSARQPPGSGRDGSCGHHPPVPRGRGAGASPGSAGRQRAQQLRAQHFSAGPQAVSLPQLAPQLAPLGPARGQ